MNPKEGTGAAWQGLSRSMACDTIRAALGRCAMAARQPLELIILVRIQAPQPDFPACKRGFFSENGPRAALLAAQAHFI